MQPAGAPGEHGRPPPSRKEDRNAVLDEGDAPELSEIPAFAHAAIAGDHVCVTGMIGVTDDFSGVMEVGIAPETRQALRHVDTVLRACDASLADVVKVSAYLVDVAEWEAMNEAPGGAVKQPDRHDERDGRAEKHRAPTRYAD